MVKKLAGIIIIAFLLLLGFWAEAWSTEGTRMLQLPGTEFKVEVPEMCPDFHLFPGNIVGVHKFSNGNAMALIEAANEDQTVFATIIVAKIGKQMSVIVVEVSYFPKDFKGDPDKIKQDWYEDSQFMKTGKFGNKLTRVEKATDYKVFKKYLAGTEI